MTRGFQIWSQNLNLAIFEPIFGQKMAGKWLKTGFYQFSTFLAKKRSNVVRFNPRQCRGELVQPPPMSFSGMAAKQLSGPR